MPSKLLPVLLFAMVAGRLAAAEIDLGAPTSRTPYDAYLDPVWKVFHQLSDQQPDRSVVEQWVREGRAFRYAFKKEQPFVPQLPEQTEATKSGDCKAKSLWLAAKMNCRKLRFVIGKFHLGDAQSHAWLIWDAPGGWLVLDATNFSRPLTPDGLSASELVPDYSYSPGGKYLHNVSPEARGAKYGDHL